MRRKLLRRSVWIVLIGFATLVILLPFGYATTEPIEFNQCSIEASWARAGQPLVPFFTRATRQYHLGLDRVFRRRASVGADPLRFDSPQSVFAFVFDHLPPTAVVYPTETYYYFRFHMRDRLVSGNVRFVDIDDGIVHMGYFDVYDRRESNAGSFDGDSGVEVSKVGASQYDVTFNGRTVRFILATDALCIPERIRLADEEEAISGILDESGIPFILAFNDRTNGFFYILNETLPLIERLHHVEGSGGELLIGEDSRFVYFNDRERDRRILVGVLSKNIYENNVYDGPFDQVPPRLMIGGMLEAAYPYVRFRGGIDNHGNFIALEHQRVAISPYQSYQRVDDLLTLCREMEDATATNAELIARLTYETKRDFHLRLAGADSPIFVKQGWPANHYGEKSSLWGADHTYEFSAAWPPDHHRDESALQEGVAPGSLLASMTPNLADNRGLVVQGDESLEPDEIE